MFVRLNRRMQPQIIIFKTNNCHSGIQCNQPKDFEISRHRVYILTDLLDWRRHNGDLVRVVTVVDECLILFEDLH